MASGTKKRAVQESEIEDGLTELCRANGVYQHKNTGRNGIPDRLLVHQGRVWFLELKRPGEKPTALQEAVARDLRRHGAVTLWADSHEAVRLVVAALVSGQEPPRERLYGLPANLAKLAKLAPGRAAGDKKNGGDI